MKKVIVLAIAAMLLLSGCKGKIVGSSSDNTSKESRFVTIEENPFSWDVVYDKETRVTYAVSNGSYNRGVFTVLVDGTGKPLLYGGAIAP